MTLTKVIFTYWDTKIVMGTPVCLKMAKLLALPYFEYLNTWDENNLTKVTNEWSKTNVKLKSTQFLLLPKDIMKLLIGTPNKWPDNQLTIGACRLSIIANRHGLVIGLQHIHWSKEVLHDQDQPVENVPSWCRTSLDQWILLEFNISLQPTIT